MECSSLEAGNSITIPISYLNKKSNIQSEMKMTRMTGYEQTISANSLQLKVNSLHIKKVLLELCAVPKLEIVMLRYTLYKHFY